MPIDKEKAQLFTYPIDAVEEDFVFTNNVDWGLRKFSIIGTNDDFLLKLQGTRKLGTMESAEIEIPAGTPWNWSIEDPINEFTITVPMGGTAVITAI